MEDISPRCPQLQTLVEPCSLTEVLVMTKMVTWFLACDLVEGIRRISCPKRIQIHFSARERAWQEHLSIATELSCTHRSSQRRVYVDRILTLWALREWSILLISFKVSSVKGLWFSRMRRKNITKITTLRRSCPHPPYQTVIIAKIHMIQITSSLLVSARLNLALIKIALVNNNAHVISVSTDSTRRIMTNIRTVNIRYKKSWATNASKVAAELVIPRISTGSRKFSRSSKKCFTSLCLVPRSQPSDSRTILYIINNSQVTLVEPLRVRVMVSKLCTARTGAWESNHIAKRKQKFRCKNWLVDHRNHKRLKFMKNSQGNPRSNRSNTKVKSYASNFLMLSVIVRKSKITRLSC